jgi:hypothetical protein
MIGGNCAPPSQDVHQTHNSAITPGSSTSTSRKTSLQRRNAAAPSAIAESDIIKTKT